MSSKKKDKKDKDSLEKKLILAIEKMKERKKEYESLIEAVKEKQQEVDRILQKLRALDKGE